MGTAHIIRYKLYLTLFNFYYICGIINNQTAYIMTIKSLLVAIIAIFSVSELMAQRQTTLIPQPQSIETLSDKTVHLRSITQHISTDRSLPAEGYTIKIKGSRATIIAADSVALVWAKHTMQQLKDGNGEYPEVLITDYPAFPIRGFMHDSGRNFMEIDMIKQYIDLLSSYKLNVFHWHLTDNPAWRIECKIYPELNDAKFHRATRDPGRFYTYDQIRDVIYYARERGVSVIPEIDMPGHSAFFKRTFGVGMDSAKGMKILEECLAEFFEEIPQSLCPYFHIGSDEVHIEDPTGFMSWAEQICEKYGRHAISWDPGLPASPTTIRQLWNTSSVPNSNSKEYVGQYLDSYMGYLNYYDPIVFTYRNILHNPCSTGWETMHAVGGILCMWNDVRVVDKSKLITHNGVISALLPFAERFWSGGSLGHESNANILPNPSSEVGQKLQNFERKMIFHRDSILRTPNFRWVANSGLQWNIEIPDAGKAIRAWGGAIDMNAIADSLGYTFTDNDYAVATTMLRAKRDTTIYAWVGFEVSARSNRKGNGIGEQGEWETGSQIFVNGEEVSPAVPWVEPGKYNFKFHTWHKPQEEMPYTDEQFYWTRPPVLIKLKKGDNTIKLISRKTFKIQRWSFAFIPISLSLDGSVSEAKY